MSKEVKRYDHAGDHCGPRCGFEESEDGDWVRASDYDAILAERDALAKHLSSAIRYIHTGDMRDLNLTEALASLQGAQP